MRSRTESPSRGYFVFREWSTIQANNLALPDGRRLHNGRSTTRGVNLCGLHCSSMRRRLAISPARCGSIFNTMLWARFAYTAIQATLMSDATVNDFIDAVQEEYGRTLSDADAHLILYDLATYFDTLAKIAYRERIAQENTQHKNTSRISESEHS